MNNAWPWLAGLAGSGLLFVSCGGGKPPPIEGETAQPVGTPDAKGGTLTVSINEVALNHGDLFLRSNSSPFTGLVNDKWPNGTLKYQCAYQGGKKHGPELAWHEDGARRMAAQFKNGNREGLTQHWWPNGKPMSIETYLNGKPHGEAKGWHKDGKLARTEKYEAGQKAGTSEGWWKNGNRHDSTTFFNGKPNGWQVKWFSSGRTNSVVFFVNGTKHGSSTTWHLNGQKSQHLVFVKGKPHGDMIEWHPNGQQKALEKYVNGVQHGQGAGWFENGKVDWQGNWLNGKRQGIFVRYHPNGVRKLQIEYNAGILRRKTSFNEQEQVTEDIVVPSGRTIHWPVERLTNLIQNKKQIADLFGRPDKVVGNVWTYSGIYVNRDQKIQQTSIRISFDPSGRCQVTVQDPPRTRVPPIGDPQSK